MLQLAVSQVDVHISFGCPQATDRNTFDGALAAQAAAMTTSGPFRGTRARALGLHTTGSLRHRCVRVLPDVYLQRDVELSPAVLARAAACWAGEHGVVTGWSAATMLGARWINPHEPEVSLPNHVRTPRGLVVHQLRLDPDEVEDVDGVAVTTPLRTAYDLGRRLDLVPAVAAVDQLCALGLCNPADLAALAARHPGDRGCVRLRRVLELADPRAESPRESALRVLLLQAGLPRPRSQARVHDQRGCFVARVDLGWERWQVAAEYEGAHHRSGRQFTRDIDRYDALRDAGWNVVRVTSTHMSVHPGHVVARVAAALRKAGAR